MLGAEAEVAEGFTDDDVAPKAKKASDSALSPDLMKWADNGVNSSAHPGRQRGIQ